MIRSCLQQQRTNFVVTEATQRIGELIVCSPTYCSHHRTEGSRTAGQLMPGEIGATDQAPQRYRHNVAKTAKILLEEALTLPAQDRVMIASSSLASLDGDGTDEADVDQLWSAETARRARQLESGDAELVTWEHLVQRTPSL